MPAPDRATLYNVAPQVEEAIRSLLTAANVASEIHVSLELDDLSDSRIDVICEVGANYNNREWAWSAQLFVSVITARSTDAAGVHGARVGGVIAALPRVPCGASYHPGIGADVLPYHVINWINLVGIDPRVGSTQDRTICDLSEMRFDLVVSVRPGAFPVVNTNTADSGYTADTTEITADAA